MSKKIYLNDIEDLFNEIKELKIAVPDNTLEGNAVALGQIQVRNKILDLIKTKFE